MPTTAKRLRISSAVQAPAAQSISSDVAPDSIRHNACIKSNAALSQQRNSRSNQLGQLLQNLHTKDSAVSQKSKQVSNIVIDQFIDEKEAIFAEAEIGKLYQAKCEDLNIKMLPQ